MESDIGRRRGECVAACCPEVADRLRQFAVAGIILTLTSMHLQEYRNRMIKKAEELKPGDRRMAGAEEWVVEAAELQEGLMQVLWRRGEERQWNEYAPNSALLVEPVPTPQRVRLVKNAGELVPGDVRIGSLDPPYAVTHVERSSDRVVVEWSNGSAIRVREYDPYEGILVETEQPVS